MNGKNNTTQQKNTQPLSSAEAHSPDVLNLARLFGHLTAENLKERIAYVMRIGHALTRANGSAKTNGLPSQIQLAGQMLAEQQHDGKPPTQSQIAGMILAEHGDDISYVTGEGFHIWDRHKRVWLVPPWSDDEIGHWAEMKGADANWKVKRVGGHLMRRTRAKEQFDAIPHLIGLPNGQVYDADKQQIRPAEQDDRVTKAVDCEPADGDPAADEFRHIPDGTAYKKSVLQAARHSHEPGLWASLIGHLTRSLENPAAARIELQKYAGLCMTGFKSQQFLFLSGASRSGKSTFAQTVLRLAGDYGQAINPRLMTHLYHAQTDWIADLCGKRCAVCEELTGSLESI